MWGLIFKLGFGFIQYFLFAKKAKREELLRRFISFVEKHDSNALDNVRLRKDYRDLLDELKNPPKQEQAENEDPPK